LFKPERIANVEFQFQIVDTHKNLKTRSSIGFPAGWPLINRTLLMFRTYKDGKLYVSPQNGGLYDAIFNEGQKGIVEYERAMSQPSPIYGKWPEPKPDFIDNVLATGKAIGYELLQTGPRVYDLGQITAGYVSLRFFDKDLDVKLISDIGRATQSGNFSTEGREFIDPAVFNLKYWMVPPYRDDGNHRYEKTDTGSPV
jgi:hypothetical protein